MNRTDLINEAVETLISTRDVCGNEREALRDFQADNGKLTPTEIAAVWQAFESEWNRHQVAAGVKFPIHADERRAINRVIERGL